MINKILNYSIKKKIRAGYVIALALLVLLLYVTTIFSIVLITNYEHIIKYYAVPQGDIGMLMTSVTSLKAYTGNAILFEDEESINLMIEYHDVTEDRLDEQLADIEATIVTDIGETAMEHINDSMNKLIKLDSEIISLGTNGNPDTKLKALELWYIDYSDVYKECMSSLKELMSANTQLITEKSTFYHTSMIVISVLTLITSIATSIILFKLGNKIAESLSIPMNKLVERLKKFNDGDVVTEFPASEYNDEVSLAVTTISGTMSKLIKIMSDLEHQMLEMGKGNFDITSDCAEEYVGDFNDILVAVNQMNSKVSEAVRDIKDSSDSVTSSSINLANASQSLAEGATEQASSVQEMLATITDISDGLKLVVNEISSSYDNAKKCSIDADASSHQMETLVTSMQNLQNTSNQIGKIIDDIEDIASQTNLLSLNASIEAARAGEAGRGFAVVADQIGKLASDSAQSAINTRSLIEGNIKEIEQAYDAVQHTSDVLRNIISQINNIAQTSKHIKEKSDYQMDAMIEAEKGIQRISEVVESNSAAAEETAATSDELQNQASNMNDIINRFKLRN